MKLSEYLKPLPMDARADFAERCGTSFLHLRNIAFSGKSCGYALAVAIEKESSGAVRRWDLRPQDWPVVWPELVGAEGAPAPTPEATHAG